MPFFAPGAPRRSLFYPFLVLPLFACSSSSSPDLHVDAASPIDGSIPPIDTGIPTDAPLPKDLETCNDTASPSQPGPTGIIAFAGTPAALGDGVRNGALIGSLMTATSEASPEQGVSTSETLNAVPLSSGDHVLDNELSSKTGSEPYTFELVPNGDAKLLAYESAATVDATTDVALRDTFEVFQTGVFSDDFTPTAGATPKASDTYVFEVNAMALFDATVSVRFTKDAACHVKNIARILGQTDGPVALNDVLASGDATRALVEKYAKTAPASSVVITMLTTLTTAPSIDLPKLSCTFTDLTTCDAVLSAFESAESAFGKIEANGAPTKADYLTQMMPNGWTYSTVETQSVGD